MRIGLTTFPIFIGMLYRYPYQHFSNNLSRWWESDSRPLPYQGSALPLSYNGVDQFRVLCLEFGVTEHQTHNAKHQTYSERKTGLEPATWSLEGYRSTKWATSANANEKIWKCGIVKIHTSRLQRTNYLKACNFHNSTFTHFHIFNVGREGFEPPYSWENRFTVCRL